MQLKKLDEQISEPNRSYVLKYKDYLELNNRKPRIIERRLHELRQTLLFLAKDAKKATKEDIEGMLTHLLEMSFYYILSI